jgi:hypothetical protein
LPGDVAFNNGSKTLTHSLIFRFWGDSHLHDFR